MSQQSQYTKRGVLTSWELTGGNRPSGQIATEVKKESSSQGNQQKPDIVINKAPLTAEELN